MARAESREGSLREAHQLLDQAEEYADEMGLQKLKIDGLCVRASITLAQGGSRQAGQQAARAIGLAARNGMHLRKVSALILYGHILGQRGQRDLARHVLNNARREAARFGYQLNVERADRYLCEIGPPELF